MKSKISLNKALAFPDFIGVENKVQRRRFDDRDDSSRIRGFLLPFCLLIFLLILFVKLVSLQLFQGNYYRELANNNRVRTKIIHAPRGIILDRNGTPLVFNIPGFRQVENGKTKLVEREQALKVIAKGEKSLEIDSLREYPYKEIFAHVLGYVGQISPEELGKEEFKTYKIDDLVGKDGIEQEYEKKLRGVNGRELIEVDATGKAIRTLGQEDPIPGENIKLTLDAKLQKAAFLAMEKVKKGAVIVSSPTGEILALVSKPSFDPNLFTLGEYYASSPLEYKNISDVLLDSENQPLLNRAVSGVYPPGSTFKIITAASALENKAIDENFQVEDTGILQLGAFSFGNWYFNQYGKTEGFVNVVSALKRSNDIFFYKVAEKVGIEKLSETARKFGLGEKSGIDLEGEAKGTVPSDAWKKKVIGEQWYLGDTYHYGIGQGYLLTTPIQVNLLTQVIANGGNIYQPHLLKSSKFKVQSSKLLSEKTLTLIRQGMIESCAPGGVAWPLFEFKVQRSKLKVDGRDFLEVPASSSSAEMTQVSIACKTGTAQHGEEQTLPHSWITLFAPAYKPQIVVTVLAELDGEGSNIAAPIAKQVLESWFGRN
ncbi:MAG: penicillin-binding transpeptidase domain-containing protein [Patescibacteria group bacterium]|nr:penicillin-binding transpeptidase domain-containing protein [Patescibacteria group bacterium]